MASPVYTALLRAGISERFLRSTAGNSTAIRAQIAARQDLWQTCEHCHKDYVLVTRLPDAARDKNGRDLRGNAKMPHELGLCSWACAIDRHGDREEAVRAIRTISLARSFDFYQSREWLELRYEVIKAQGARCNACGQGRDDGAVIQVDHIRPRFTHPRLALDISNLQVLCRDCNMGKGCRDATDWRSRP